MAVKHRCPNLWVKVEGHPCWRVQKALDEQGIEYEIVKGPLRRGKRNEAQRLSGQRQYPVRERLPRAVEGYGGDPRGQAVREGEGPLRRRTCLSG